MAAIAFTNVATEGLWWDSKRKKERSPANAVVCHRPVHLRLSWRQTRLMSTAATSNCCCIHGDTGSRTGHNFSLCTSIFTLTLFFLLFYTKHVSLYLFACEAILLYSDCFHIVCVSSFGLKNSVHCHINFTACFSIESVGKSDPACVRRCITIWSTLQGHLQCLPLAHTSFEFSIFTFSTSYSVYLFIFSWFIEEHWKNLMKKRLNTWWFKYDRDYLHL